MTMLISNLVLLLIPVSMGAFLYTKVEASLENGANRSNKAMLEQLKLSLDGKLNEVEKLAQQIIFDPKLEYLLKLSGNPDSPDRYKFIEFMQNTMSRPGNITNFILDYYVYFDKSDLVLKSGLMTDSRKFYDMYYSYQGMSYEQWREEMLGSFLPRRCSAGRNTTRWRAWTKIRLTSSRLPNPFPAATGRTLKEVLSP